MTVKTTETTFELIKDFIVVKLETLYDAILLEVSQQKECVKKNQHVHQIFKMIMLH